jgi:hypothetical protein
VDDHIDLIAVDRAPDGCRIGAVGLHERDIAHGGPVPELHRIERHHVAATLMQKADGMRADVAGTACDQDRHLSS